MFGMERRNKMWGQPGEAQRVPRSCRVHVSKGFALSSSSSFLPPGVLFSASPLAVPVTSLRPWIGMELRGSDLKAVISYLKKNN